MVHGVWHVVLVGFVRVTVEACVCTCGLWCVRVIVEASGCVQFVFGCCLSESGCLHRSYITLSAVSVSRGQLGVTWTEWVSRRPVRYHVDRLAVSEPGGVVVRAARESCDSNFIGSGKKRTNNTRPGRIRLRIRIRIRIRLLLC